MNRRDLWAAVKERANGRCEECGRAQDPSRHRDQPHVHHKNLNSQDDRLDNLQLLCPQCHGRKHGGSCPPRFTVKKLVLLSPEDATDLKWLCGHWHCEGSEAVRRAIREATKREKKP